MKVRIQMDLRGGTIRKTMEMTGGGNFQAVFASQATLDISHAEEWTPAQTGLSSASREQEVGHKKEVRGRTESGKSL